MPARGDRSAPQFDPQQPRELRRYFADLDFAFTRAGIADREAKKKHACRYVDVDTADLWESIAEFTNANSSYEEFTKAVHALYPGSEEERKWSVADMDKLVGERSRLGIISLADLGEYFRQFYTITTFLRSKNRLSESEQSRAFVRGFQPDLWASISQRLQLKLPDHFPDDPYKLDEIHEAARFVLHGTPSRVLTLSSPSVPFASTAPTRANNEIKTEDLAAILERITETFVKALAANNGGGSSFSRPPPRSDPNSGCNYCGDLHFIRDCAKVIEDIKAGLCKRNTEGKVTLPSGAFVPREIPGKYLRERIEEWHHRNPGQMAAAQMLYHVLSNGITENTLSSRTTETSRITLATRETHPELFTPTPAPAIASVSTPAPVMQLSADDRIASLERELFQLRGRKFEPQARTRAQHEADKGKRREQSAAPLDRDPSIEIEEEPVRPVKKKAVPEVVIPVQRNKATQPEPGRSTDAPEPEPPVHPFAEARDATYAAPQNRNFAAPPKPSAQKKAEPAYRTLPPIYDEKIAANVYDRAMDAPVTLTQRELLSLSPEVRSQVREATSAKRTQPKEGNAKEIHTYAEDDLLAYAFDDIEQGDSRITTSTFVNAIHQPKTPPPGSIVIPDPYELYVNSLPQGAVPDCLVVAKESSALRAIHPLVDHQRHVEAILDPGSQIIAMAEDVCFDLGLAYDPTIILNMQSANGEVDQSLGLARNVPIQIGDMTLYIQVHIIRSPAYDILLGRPFDILTESVVRNYANEDQTITIFDPNSGRRATVPTSARGRPRRPLQRPNFTASMN